MRSWFLSFCVLLFCCTASAQHKSYVVKGAVTDTTNFLTTQYASISLLRAADSVLLAFTRAEADGSFRLEVDSSGKYLLMMAHPQFATSIDNVTVRDSLTDLGEQTLISKRQLLQEVVITDKRAIVIKGDTVEYNADSFQTAAYDNVDELLKKLPGIEIGADGSIKAYGEKVQKMLVDGEEFFSDDPAVVAQTLRASSVDKVQVFDKKSDQASFTGIDDGERVKTINLKLKENAKQGYFGKVSAGGALPGYWDNSAMINAFKGKRKIAAYGVTANTKTSGLGWGESEKYGGGGGMVYEEGDDGTYYQVGGMDDGNNWGGEYRGQGLPTTWTGGAHYSNKWLKDSLIFSGNYAYRNSAIDELSNTRTQYILPDTQYIADNTYERRTVSEVHNVSTSTEWLIDSTSSIRLRLSGNHTTSRNTSETSSHTATMGDVWLNDNQAITENTSTSDKVNANLFYRKKFRKKGRTISANWQSDWSRGVSKGTMMSEYTLFQVDSSYSFDQRKYYNSNGLNSNVKLSYTEPFSEKVFLELNYSFQISNNESERLSYDRQPDDDTDVLNELYSSSYVFNRYANQGGANLRLVWGKKVNLSFGGNVSDTRFTQADRLDDTTFRYNYLNFFPRMNFRYNKSQQSSFSLNYNGNTSQPQLFQLQPLRDNTDPLNMAIGNPDLKQEFRHNFRASYNDYKVMSRRSIYFNLQYTYVQHAISQQQFIDDDGRRVYQYINVDGNQNAWMNMSYGLSVVKDLYADLNLSASYNSDQNYINYENNVSRYLSATPGMSLRYYKDTTISISYRFSPRYNYSLSSIRLDVPLNYWNFNQQFSGSYRLPAGFKIGMEIEWNIREKLSETEQYNNLFVWNGYVSKTFLKDKSLEAKLYANDILNQNVGYRRMASGNQLTDNTYNTVRQYFMLSLAWNFTRTGKTGSEEDNIIQED